MKRNPMGGWGGGWGTKKKNEKTSTSRKNRPFVRPVKERGDE